MGIDVPYLPLEDTMPTGVKSKSKAKPSATELRAEARRRFHEAHPGEFDRFMVEVYAEHGLEYRKRLTPQERAEREKAEKKAKAAAAVAAYVAEFGRDILPEPPETHEFDNRLPPGRLSADPEAG